MQNKPTLPFAQIFGSGNDGGAYGDVEPVQPAPFREPGQLGHRPGVRPPVRLIEGVPTYAYPNGAVPGPRPPKSWTSLFDHEEKKEPAWRAEVLQVLFDDVNAPGWAREPPEERGTMLPLVLSCALVLLQTCRDPEALKHVANYMPAHVRRDLVRWCAVWKPLSSSRLYALCGDEGHADGELIVVGPQASLRGNVLKKDQGWERRHDDPMVGNDDGQAVDSWSDMDNWDAMSLDSPPPLTRLVLITTPLLSELLSDLPPTLTHLALLDLPQPAPIHRLPRVCPLLEVLDLSYNRWLSEKDAYGAGTSQGAIHRVDLEWRRWGHLRVLGLRECGVNADIVARINAGRWTDVEVIGLNNLS
jgi:hypothetical protein